MCLLDSNKLVNPDQRDALKGCDAEWRIQQGENRNTRFEDYGNLIPDLLSIGLATEIDRLREFCSMPYN